MASRLWIGGATDAGKTTAARRLALIHTLALYECDRTDRAHHEQLATSLPAYRDMLDQSLDERWVETTPQALLQRALESFADRFALILGDLERLARRGRPVLAEGFCLTPDLVAPHLEDARRAIWLIPTETFKHRSWQRRGKPSWRDEVSDPARGADNLFTRDLLLGQEIARQAQAHGFATLTVDAAVAEDTLTAQLQERFGPFLESG
ncbi:MAG TPA: hypothetical protein VMU93_01955 [Caulobacteraceae bacterium]|nr:hypothetical protein [Caulobacteraceae bacterium]